MKYVRPKPIDGRLGAPPSKSLMVRAVAAAALAPGPTWIENPADCDDARAALGVARAMGCAVEPDGGALRIEPGAGRPEPVWDCGESGLSLRLFAAVAGLFAGERRLTGRGTLLRRPLGMVAGPLGELGAACRTADGRLPLRVRGPLAGGRARVDASESSQFLSGLLMALPLVPAPSELEIIALRSRPYVELTLELLARFGIELETDPDLGRVRVPGSQAFRPGLRYRVEGDWSGAAALLVAGALAGRVCLTDLRADSLQADRALVEALRAAGARVEVSASRVAVERGRPRAFAFDATDCPDLLPPLVALACSCPGRTELAGAGRLRHKESDRAAALVAEFSRLGAAVRLDGDRLLVEGGPLRFAEVDAHADHRMAMALAAGALGAGVAVGIRGAGCVAKSYPGFFDDLAALGAEVQ